jgi:signal transduction histidine kinase
LHFSLELSDHGTGTAVISVSDVLSLLGRDPTGRPASRTTRAMLFLGMVCSQLPLTHVIAAQDTPAELTLDRRMALAWLLHILGFTVTAADLDRLRVLGGGHQVPLWHLIDAARDDPVGGIGRLWERPDRDEILHAGLAADLDSETDLLVLSTLLEWNAGDRADLATALDLVWADVMVSPQAHAEVKLDAAVDRLIAKGYLREAGGRLYSCSCPVVRAQHRRSKATGEIQHLVQRVHATLEVHDLMYRDLLDFAWHADQAETALRSKEEQQATARRATDARMSDRTPFDLRQVCAEAARRADLVREDVDVYWESRDGGPAWMAGPEAPWDYLVRELLTNAISAVGRRGADQSGSVWLCLETGDEEATATLVVSDDGPGFPDDFREAFAQRRPLVRPDRPNRGNVFHKLRLYAEQHGARFELGERAEGGAVVTVHLRLVTGPNSGIMR